MDADVILIKAASDCLDALDSDEIYRLLDNCFMSTVERIKEQSEKLLNNYHRGKVMSDNERKAYLGDGVYATDYGHCIRLTSEDGINILAAIYLETDMIRTLCKFAGVLLHGD